MPVTKHPFSGNLLLNFANPLNPIKHSQKKILITGGTSTLGQAFVRKALQDGCEVYFTYYQNRDAASRLKEAGAWGFPLNLLDSEAIRDFPKLLASKTSTLDILIHNAALVRDRTIERLSEADWDEVMAVNLKAPFCLTRQLLSFLEKKKSSKISENRTPSWSKIFMMTSRAAWKGGIGISNYAASKAGMIGLMKSLAQELGGKGILVNAVNPGFMKSQMTADLPPEVLERHLAESALSRYSEPEEVAGFLAYLCSEEMSQVTGQVFNFESRSTLW